uniref:Peptidase S1 domain-containing protein n=1 Tax=Anopheles maculatus TaxID=74869 RepID=A0A182T298_9DIPT
MYMPISIGYCTISRENELDESAAESTIEAKWKRLQQQEDNEKLRIFDMDSCGESISVQGNAQSYTYMPWIGSLQGVEDPSTAASRLISNIVLISAWYALAPAHVFNNSVLWRSITLGYYDRIIYLRCVVLKCDPPYQEIQIKRIIIHPDYDGTLNANNIALIELLEPANLTKPFISPICLPFMQEFQTSPPIQMTLSTSLTDSRRVVRLSALNCQARLIHRRRFFFNQEIPMCADEYESGVKRFADHPGSALQASLFFADQKRHFLNGISFLLEATSAENEELPYLFTDTSLHLDWILENMDIARDRNVSLNDRISIPSRINRAPVRLALSKGRLLNFGTCGMYSNDSADSFAGEPWLGVVDAWDPQSKSYQYTKCAVTLISDMYAVGPARCLNHEVDKSFVQFGGYTKYAQDECDDENCRIQSVPIEKIILHPNYNPVNQDNNIALVQLATPADISKANVKPICLPVQDEIRSYDVSSMAVGSVGPYSKSYVTKRIDERYIDSSECQKRWDGLSVNLAIKSRKLCTLLPEGLKCYDIKPGFALHTTHNLLGKERRFLRGIKTEQPDGCSEYYPIVYTDVDVYLDWILESMNVTGTGQALSYDLTEHLIFV